jgi:hypothetical protein
VELPWSPAVAGAEIQQGIQKGKEGKDGRGRSTRHSDRLLTFLLLTTVTMNLDAHRLLKANGLCRTPQADDGITAVK